jgi:hypothetical protein
LPAHIFVLDNINFNICKHRGIVGLPEAETGSRNEQSTNDALLSRMAIIKDGDYILFYITGVQELHGVWQAVGKSFFDKTQIWENKIYPFRCRIDSTKYSFSFPIHLNDIIDLKNSGKIWTWALTRPSGTNAMFSISNSEFNVLLQEYLKINPFTMNKHIVMEPYPVKPSNLSQYIHRVDNGSLPRYEYSLMSMLLNSYTENKFQDIFGNYSDYISYVPTNLGKEIDILLLYNNPDNIHQTMSYDIVEVKLDRFDGKALKQLIGYESWFINKRVQGDMNMVRVSAIAKRFDSDVIDYVNKRHKYENKIIKLLIYNITNEGELVLQLI